MSIAEVLEQYGDKYLAAILTPWQMTAIGFSVAFVLAILIPILRVSPIKPLRLVGDLYVQIFRNIPGVSLLIICVYALPNLGLLLEYKTCVMVAVILLASAFGSENFMSGINTIGVGQIEAARSVGLTFLQIMRHVVIPQALRSAVLPMTNLLIATLLTTALGSQVPLNPQELTGLVSYINTRSTGGILTFVISAVCYAGTGFIIGHFGNILDKKVRILR